MEQELDELTKRHGYGKLRSENILLGPTRGQWRDNSKGSVGLHHAGVYDRKTRLGNQEQTSKKQKMNIVSPLC